jgi:hypothetical protein
MLNESAKLPKVKDSLIEQILLGNKLTPELIAILTIYFVQGILMLSRLAVSFFLKDELLLSPAQMSAIIGIIWLPQKNLYISIGNYRKCSLGRFRNNSS